MGSERSHSVFSANVKLDRFLQREKGLIESSAANVRQEIACQQRLAYSRFRKSYFKAESNHAQLYLDKDEKREIDRVIELERDYGNNAIAYRRMLANRVATAPSVIARTLLTPASAKSRPQTKQSSRTDRSAKTKSDQPNSGNPSIKKPTSDTTTKQKSEKSEFERDNSNANGQTRTQKVFLTETNLINNRKGEDSLIQSNTKSDSENSKTKPRPKTSTLTKSNSFATLGSRPSQRKQESLDAMARELEDYKLKDAVTYVRYPYSGDAYSRVSKRMGKYICRPQEVSNKEVIDGVEQIRESDTLKQHREAIKRSNFEERIARLAKDVENHLKMDAETSPGGGAAMDFVGEETMRRVRARRVTQMQPTPDDSVERHCGVFARIPRSHTFSNWTLD
ncbi:uncharacterized protein LOC142339035 [Convolutriloba macropyga]|uniref:uncharacterized protein LOC142339035 n=1 Tax=Convolutriloba macropyga TaxID=536237 RepID=UPI003F5230E8